MTRTKNVKAFVVVLLSLALMIAFMPSAAFTSYAATASKVTKITKVKGVKSSYTFVAGKSYSFKVKLSPKNLKSTKKTTTVTSSKTSVATISSKKYSKSKGYYYVSFKVNAKAAGKTAVKAYAKYGKKTASWTITVKKSVTGVTVSNTTNAAATAPMVGDILKAKATPSGATVSYQWYADGVAISGASDYEYTLTNNEYGKAITCKVTGVGYSTGSVTSTATGKVTEAKVTGAKIALADGQSGVIAGSTLSVETTPTNADVTYQWYNGSNVALANGTASTYVIPMTGYSSNGYYCIVKGQNGYTGTATTATVNVCTALSSVEVAPTTSTAKVGLGVELTATAYYMSSATIPVKTAAASDVTYKWYIDSVSDSNQIYSDAYATGSTQTAVIGSTFTPATTGFYLKGASAVTSMQGHKIIAVAVGGGTTYTGTVTSVATDTLASTLSSATTSLVTTGKSTIGYKVQVAVTASDGPIADLTKASTLTYQWYRGINAISGANSSSYTITSADAGQSLSCKVTGSGNYSGTVDSTAVAAVGTATAIDGVTVVNNDTTKTGFSLGDTLKASVGPTGAEAAAGNAVTYQWYKGSVADANKVGTDSATYTPTTIGDYLVTVTLKSGNTDFTLASPATSLAVTVKAPITSVTVSNTTATTAKRTTYAVGDIMTATVAPATAAITTDYKLIWTKTSATGAVTTLTPEADGTYKLVAGDVNSTIKCTATATSGGTVAGKATSDPISITFPVSAVTVSGGSGTTLWTANPAIGTTYTATATSISTATPVVTYQWYRSGVAIDKATTATYTPVAADYGKALSVTVTGKDGFTGTATLAATGLVTGTKTLEALAQSPAEDADIVAGSTITISFDDVDVNLGATSSDVTYKWYRSTETSLATAVITANLTNPAKTTEITAATGASYTTTSADSGMTVFCMVTTKTGTAFTVPADSNFGCQVL